MALGTTPLHLVPWITAGVLAVAIPSVAQQPAADDVRCTAAGYDVIIFNDRPEVLAAGTEVGWEVPFLRKEGVYVHVRGLDPSASVFVSAALGSTYLVAEKPCSVSIRSD
jgi:hypothetical protein